MPRAFSAAFSFSVFLITAAFSLSVFVAFPCSGMCAPGSVLEKARSDSAACTCVYSEFVISVLASSTSACR